MPQTLATFPNPHPTRDYHVEHQAQEFTSLCPMTGQPDFATITIRYVPGATCIELESYDRMQVVQLLRRAPKSAPPFETRSERGGAYRRQPFTKRNPRSLAGADRHQRCGCDSWRSPGLVNGRRVYGGSAFIPEAHSI